MKMFITRKRKKRRFELVLISIIFFTCLFINFYNKKISPKIINISETKLEEITNMYVKNNIVPDYIDLETLVKIDKNKKEEIVSLDIDTNYANQLMVETIKKIQGNIFNLEFKDEMLKKYKNNIYLEIPISLARDGAILSNLGPKIPIKISFYEHAFGNIAVELTDYGINNALLKVFLEVELEQKLYIPYKENKNKKVFRLLIASKIISGTVPGIYGAALSKNSEILGLNSTGSNN